MMSTMLKIVQAKYTFNNVLIASCVPTNSILTTYNGFEGVLDAGTRK